MMASSRANKHWPSLFKKSKPSNNLQINWQQHGINSSLLSTTPFQTPTLGVEGEDKTPEPKPRWNPKPEQIQILEAIFNSGMVNPPRDEIKKIRKQLQEFGQVGDANVFYWFQNRKSRSKNKHRIRHPYNNSRSRNNKNNNVSDQVPVTAPPPNSSSSDHQNVSPNEMMIPVNDGVVVLPNSQPESVSVSVSVNVNQNQLGDGSVYYNHTPTETNFQLPTPPFFSYPTEPYWRNDDSDHQFSNMIQQPALPLLNHNEVNIMNYGNGIPSMDDQFQHDQEIQDNNDLQLGFHVNSNSSTQLGFHVATNSSANDDDHDSSSLVPLPPVVIDNAPHGTVPFPMSQFQGDEGDHDDGRGKCRVITNDTVYEAEVGPFNVREMFGDGAVLFDSGGQPVLTDEWGVTLYSLHPGASYYLVSI